MTRPPLEVADLVGAAGTTFFERSRHWIRWTHRKVLLAIARCRTDAFHRSVFASIPAGEKRDLASVYQDLLKAGKLAAYYIGSRTLL
jgi:hypothetical protein